MSLYKYPKVNEIYYHTGFQTHLRITSVETQFIDVELFQVRNSPVHKKLSYGISMWDYFTRNKNIILVEYEAKTNMGHPLTKIFK
jgi:hypothetical protein